MFLTNFSQKILLVSGLFLMGNILISSHADAKKPFLEGMLPFLYDRGHDELLEGDAMVAPFAHPDVAIDDDASGLPENAIALDQPHRSDGDITSWVITSVSRALTFQETDYQKEINQSVNLFFTSSAATQYKTFLQETKILEILAGKQYRVNSFTQGDPILVNEGALSGRYRWLYEVPIMVSYMDRYGFDYREKNAVNQNYMLQIQIGRSSDESVDGEGIKIESWTKQ